MATLRKTDDGLYGRAPGLVGLGVNPVAGSPTYDESTFPRTGLVPRQPVTMGAPVTKDYVGMPEGERQATIGIQRRRRAMLPPVNSVMDERGISAKDYATGSVTGDTLRDLFGGTAAETIRQSPNIVRAAMNPRGNDDPYAPMIQYGDRKAVAGVVRAPSKETFAPVAAPINVNRSPASLSSVVQPIAPAQSQENFVESRDPRTVALTRTAISMDENAPFGPNMRRATADEMAGYRRQAEAALPMQEPALALYRPGSFTRASEAERATGTLGYIQEDNAYSRLPPAEQADALALAWARNPMNRDTPEARDILMKLSAGGREERMALSRDRVTSEANRYKNTKDQGYYDETTGQWYDQRGLPYTPKQPESPQLTKAQELWAKRLGNQIDLMPEYLDDNVTLNPARLKKERELRDLLNPVSASTETGVGVQKMRRYSPDDVMALNWARSNPRDPRSAAILQRLGVKG